METNKSSHILNTSSTMFGLCFVVFSSIRALKLGGETLIDECTGASMIMFMISCILSFLSIRSNNKRTRLYEEVADYVFLSGLIILFLTTIFLIFNLIK